MSFFEFPHTRTYDTDLGWLIKNYSSLDETIAAIKTWIEETEPTIEELKKLYEDLMNGNIPDELKSGINKWFKENAVDIVGSMVSMVYFGITDTGYFVAYIPESWSDVIFGTSGLDDFPPDTEFGRLTLSLDIGG